MGKMQTNLRLLTICVFLSMSCFGQKDNNSKISNIEDSGNTAESVNVSENEAHKAIRN